MLAGICRLLAGMTCNCLAWKYQSQHFRSVGILSTVIKYSTWVSLLSYLISFQRWLCMCVCVHAYMCVIDDVCLSSCFVSVSLYLPVFIYFSSSIVFSVYLVCVCVCVCITSYFQFDCLSSWWFLNSQSCVILQQHGEPASAHKAQTLKHTDTVLLQTMVRTAIIGSPSYFTIVIII